MATHVISILGASVQPDSTGLCWLEPFDVAATNDLYRHLIIRLKDPTANQHGFYGSFYIPNNYVSAPAIIPVWTTTATTGTVQWRFSYRAVGGDDAESLDQSTHQQQATGSDVAPGAALRMLKPSISLTAANFAIGDLVTYLFERLNASDTLAADALIHDLLFQYSDT